MGIAAEFRGSMAAESRRQISSAKKEIKKKLSFGFLVKILKQHHECFKRYVAREAGDEIPHPAFPEVFHYCLYHIGRIGGYEWFFDDSPGTVMVYRSKAVRLVNPRVECLGCQVSRGQIEAIVNYLDRTKMVKGADRTVGVPKDFYVFEFTAQEKSWPGGSERGEIADTVPPFQAQNLKDAIRIIKMWPNHWCYKDISNVKVHTHDGCLKLKSTLPKSAYREKWQADLSDYNYELTAE